MESGHWGGSKPTLSTPLYFCARILYISLLLCVYCILLLFYSIVVLIINFNISLNVFHLPGHGRPSQGQLLFYIYFPYFAKTATRSLNDLKFIIYILLIYVESLNLNNYRPVTNIEWNMMNVNNKCRYIKILFEWNFSKWITLLFE